jgi:preprotein translocase subunit SecF
MRILERTNIDFLGKRKLFYTISILIIVFGFICLFIKSIPLGIDFIGGTEIQVRFRTEVEIGDLRSAMDENGFSGMEIKTAGSPMDIILRTPLQSEGMEVAEKIEQTLKKEFPENQFEVLRKDKVGPKIGEELRRNAIIAIVVSLIGILIYMAFRFQFIYAVGAVIALFHDVFITLGAIGICNLVIPGLRLEFNQAMLASFLTLVGYSVNDKVVIFDRIRENMKIYKNQAVEPFMNKSINETLSRTIITGGTVFLSVWILFFFGGEINRSFAFSFGVGMITGTYSSIFVATAIVVDWKKKIENKLRSQSKAGVVASR